MNCVINFRIFKLFHRNNLLHFLWITPSVPSAYFFHLYTISSHFDSFHPLIFHTPLFHLSFFFNRFMPLSLRLHPQSPPKNYFSSFFTHPYITPSLRTFLRPFFLIITPSFLSKITAFFNFSFSHFHNFCTINF